MNLWLALAAWIGVSVPVSVAIGILVSHAKRTSHPAEHLTLPPVPGGRLTRV